MKIGKRIAVQTSLDQVMDPKYQFAESLDLVKYTDITSNVNWETVGLLENDYITCRKEVQILTATTGFSNLTLEEKKVAARMYAVIQADIDSVYPTSEEQDINWAAFVSSMKGARKVRWDSALYYISRRITPLNSLDLADASNILSGKYLQYGVESLAADGVDGLFDFLEGVASYVGIGFPSKSYWTQELQDGIMNILNK